MSKGFHNCYHNPSHDKDSYSHAENQFKQLCQKLGFEANVDFIHEKKVKTLECGRVKQFYLDFYFIRKRISVEINPMFHLTYQKVRNRDTIKRKILRRHFNIEQFNIKVINGDIDSIYASKVLEMIRNAPNSKETLEAYC